MKKFVETVALFQERYTQRWKISVFRIIFRYLDDLFVAGFALRTLFYTLKRKEEKKEVRTRGEIEN